MDALDTDNVKAESLSSDDEDDSFEANFMFTQVDIITTSQEVLVTEELFYKQVESWLCFTRSHFDCYVNGEPHQAVLFLICLKTGQFIVRVWGNTIRIGILTDLQSIKEKIQETFQGRVPCTGIISEPQEFKDRFLICEFPFSRVISSQCQFLPKASENGKDKNQFMCRSCCAVDEGNLENLKDQEGGWSSDNEPISNVMPEDFLESSVAKYESDFDFVASDSGASEGSPDSLEESEFDGDWRPKRKQARKSMPTPASNKSKSQRKSAKSKSNASHSCDICGKAYKSLSEMVRHKKTDHLFGSYQCKSCDSDFVSAGDFVTHTLNLHPEVEEIPCITCSESIEPSLYEDHCR